MSRFLVSCTLPIFFFGCQPNASDPEGVAHPSIGASDQSASPKSASNSTSSLPSPVALTFVLGDPGSKQAPPYSPPGKSLALAAVEVASSLGIDGLQTELVLGWPLEKRTSLKVLMTRSQPDSPYTRLILDTNGNGEFDDPVLEAKTSETRGKLWSNFDATIPVSYHGDENKTEDYPVAFWAVVDQASDKPDVLRVSRRGFKTAQASMDGKEFTVLLSDSNNDAVFGNGDWWEVFQDPSQKGKGMRKVGEYAWLGDKAFQLEIDNPYGGSGKLVAFDAGVTKEQDEEARDPFAADKKAVRAEKPVEFRTDAESAISEAQKANRPCFVKFETTWCGPCKLMTQFVFTAKDVVDASQGVACVKVDGDESKELVNRFAVKAYPTGVLLGPDGAEIARFVGYQKVPEMAAFLKKGNGLQ